MLEHQQAGIMVGATPASICHICLCLQATILYGIFILGNLCIFCNYCCCQLFMLHIFSASTWLVFSLLYDEETFLILMESNLSLCFYSYWSLRRKDNLNISKKKWMFCILFLIGLMFLDSIICSVGQYMYPLALMLYCISFIRSFDIR